MSPKGFSLIELVIVITIIGVLMVFSSPLWLVSSINVSAQADQIASDIIYTQSLAMTTNARYHWIRTSTNTYQIRDSTSTPILIPGPGTTTVTFEPGISFNAFTNLPNNLIAFDRLGIPYTDTSASTKLAATASIPITGDGTVKTITITPNTGRVDIL